MTRQTNLYEIVAGSHRDLRIVAADCGGHAVLSGDGLGASYPPRILFGGDIEACLDFLRREIARVQIASPTPAPAETAQ